MTMDDEQFFAWLDGELDPQAAAKVAAQVAADPELQRKAEAHRSMQARLRGAFEPLLAAPSAASNVIDLGAARKRQATRRAWPGVAQWAAIAATLVIGIVTGTMIAGSGDFPGRGGPGYIVASGPLDRALDTQLASAPSADGPRIGLTFRDQKGTLCRSFTDGSAQGLACRDRTAWRIRGLFQAPAGPSGEYRMAAGTDPALAVMIDRTILGEPFDAAAERQAKARGWSGS